MISLCLVSKSAARSVLSEMHGWSPISDLFPPVTSLQNASSPQIEIQAWMQASEPVLDNSG